MGRKSIGFNRNFGIDYQFIFRKIRQLMRNGLTGVCSGPPKFVVWKINDQRAGGRLCMLWYTEQPQRRLGEHGAMPSLFSPDLNHFLT
jgi:hypothetical protein